MVKLKGPGLSLGAAGLLGNTVIFSKWKGRPTLKFSPTVKNPNTQAQQGRRAMLRFLATSFGNLSAADITTWDSLAQAADISTYNAWCKTNMDRWARFLAPSHANPATDSGNVDGVNYADAVALQRSVRIRITPSWFYYAWGYLVYRSTTTGFTPAISNCIRTGYIDYVTFQPVNWIDGPLPPGTYYYRYDIFNDTGKKLGTYLTQHTVVLS